jgi:resuscitation-promoting factor RpfA
MTTQLPPQNPREPDEPLPGEAELAALYRQLPQSAPSPALDAAVLRAAAQALAPDEESPTVLRERRKAERERGDWVHPKAVAPSAVASPTQGHRARKSRWLIALGSAATVVLAAGLVWRTREMVPATPTPAAMDGATPAQAAKNPAQPRTAAPAVATPPTESALPPPPEPAKQPPPKMMAAPLPAPTAHTSRKAAADRSAERASDKARLIGGLHRAAPASMPAPATALQETSGNAVEAAPGATATMAAVPPAPAPSVDGITEPTASDTPAQELDKIQQLFKQGHTDEAQQRLAAFQHAHPQWDLPPELRAQLRKP